MRKCITPSNPSWIFAVVAFSAQCFAEDSGVWSQPTTIQNLGSHARWFNVVVNEDTAAQGCSGGGHKAIDLSNQYYPTDPAVKKAQVALLAMALATNKKVKLYYEGCVGTTSIIGHVVLVN